MNFQLLLKDICCLGAASLAVMGFLVWCDQTGVVPISKWIRKWRALVTLGAIIPVVCGVKAVCFGSNKPPSGTNAPPAGLMAMTPPPRMMCRPQPTLGVGTNEVWDFSPPTDATVVETWRRRGAANERVAIHSDLAIDTFGRVRTLGREFALLGRQLGMVPEAHWADLGFESLAWWTITASNSTIVTWQNALLDRDTNTPVSVQAEFFDDGRFAYRYDLSAIGADASNIVARVRTDENEDAVALTEDITSVSGFVPDIATLARIAGGVSNETVDIVSDELRSTKLWAAWTVWANTGTNALYSRTFEVDRQGGWTSYFLSGRGEAWCADGADAIGEWSLESAVMEWEDDTGASGTLTTSPTGDALYLPLATETTRVTITLRATTTSGQQVGVRRGSAVFLLEYSPRIVFNGGQELEGDDGNSYCVFTDPDDFSYSLDLSNRPCRAPADDGEVAMNGFTLPAEPGVYELPLGTRAVEDERPRLMMGPLMAPTNDNDWHRYLVILNPWVTYGTGHYGCSHIYPYDWSSFGTWCDCTPECGSGVDGYSAVNASISRYDDCEAEGVVKVAGREVWRDTAYHIVWPCDHSNGNEDERYCPCGCGADCEHCSCVNSDGPSQGSIRFRVNLGENADGETMGFAWFESEGPVAITPQLFEVESRPDADVSVHRSASRVEVTTGETGGRDLAISALTNGVTVAVKHHGETDPFETWEITNVDGSPSVVRLVKRSGGGTAPLQGETTSGQQQEEVGVIREDWTYSCSWQSGEWVWDVADNRTFDPPPRGESVEVINGTNFVFGSDGRIQRLTVGTNGEEVVIRTISYDDAGRIVLVDDGTNGFLTVAYDDAGAVTNVFVSTEDNGGTAQGPLMAPRPRLLGSGGGITVAEAIRHYLNGNGSPITLPFSVVDTSSATPIKFDCVRNFVSCCHEPDTYQIVGTNYFPATGQPRLIVGDVPVRLDGTITYTGQCNWTFHGTMTGADDPYDFNAANRGFAGETLTALGRLFLEGHGTPYMIQFSGSVPLEGSGHCGDR